MKKLVILLACSLAWAQPLPGNPTRGDVRVVVLSDINPSYGSTEYTAGVLQAVRHTTELWRPDLVLSAGDLVAGQKHDLPAARFGEMWAAFDRSIAAPLREAGIPLGVAMGNHDASSLRRADGSYAFGRERVAATRYWLEHTPDLNFVDRATFPFDYSFRSGKVFVLVWDASSARLSEATLAWAREALTGPEAQGAGLRLVIGHLPLYGIAEGRNSPGEVLENGDALRERLEAYGVHLYISGHHHAYYPAKRGELALLHTGGTPPRRLLGSDGPPRTAVTVMDIDFGEAGAGVRYTSYDLATFAEVELESLPESIDGLGGRVVRLDLAE
jgi:3',5'-cyclic AMP phosphodiesterase CpdA